MSLWRAYEYVDLPIGDCPASFAIAVSREDSEISGLRLPSAARSSAGRIAAGRGLTKDQARASCVGEVAELLSTCWWGDEAVQRACLASLGSLAIHPSAMLLVSERQYFRRQDWNARHGGYDWVPPPLDEAREIDWVEAVSPDGRDRAFVPAACVYIGYSDSGDETAFAVADSSGCAAGPTRDQAVVSGFLELVERDATALWWYGRHSRPAVNLGPLSEVRNLLAWLKDRQRRFHVLDLTTDLRIPVYAAVSAEPDGRAVAFGAAAHFDSRRAVVAALTEMLQIEISLEMRKAVPAGGGDAFQFWLDNVTLDTMPQLVPSGSRTALPDAREPGPDSSPARCTDICRRSNLTLLTVDLTRPVVGLPVTRVIVAGLRPIRARFASGRLYDVPRRLGWSKTSRREEELNATPLAI
jgi:ribosomal protein S12 methylthiotransferase accessory factor